ncbi:DUF2599 domain-containing protein [Mycolicibacterium sp.]|uniref:DUF2599 domain-containing protein n=1 Tax=Mycolicibacterium sp. TaxID=2320850 RepID=UPI001A319236|nr:DUF2599 domain-containing protein [Mycolicibacterium sp.]MBJ7338688.1 DUF2599 domain-containing protein [Mycolicibacterium sp.]
MRRLLAALATAFAMAGALTSAGLAPAAAADPIASPPFVDHTEWSHWGDLSSLRVYPTPSGRVAAAQLNNELQGDEAWTEVLALSPDADMPGMRAQFMCHWSFAEIAQPGKTSWNLEPWRPVVDDATMIDTRCNPGGTEEPF